MLAELTDADIAAREFRPMSFRLLGSRGYEDAFGDPADRYSNISLWLAEAAEHGLLG